MRLVRGGWEKGVSSSGRLFVGIQKGSKATHRHCSTNETRGRCSSGTACTGRRETRADRGQQCALHANAKRAHYDRGMRTSLVFRLCSATHISYSLTGLELSTITRPTECRGSPSSVLAPSVRVVLLFIVKPSSRPSAPDTEKSNGELLPSMLLP